MFEIFLAFNEDHLTYSQKAFSTKRRCEFWIKKQNKLIPSRSHYYILTLELDPIAVKE